MKSIGHSRGAHRKASKAKLVEEMKIGDDKLDVDTIPFTGRKPVSIRAKVWYDSAVED